MLLPWEKLPDWMKTQEIRSCWESLRRKRGQLRLKRLMDLLVGIGGLIAFLPLFLFIALKIRLEAPGPILYKQERITAGGKRFVLYKFRTMREGTGCGLTIGEDSRILPGLQWLRNRRLDELPQLINLIKGEMTLVGARPEIEELLERSGSAAVTLLLPAGVTGPASLRYQDEASLLAGNPDPVAYYKKVILPDKLRLGRAYVEKYRIWEDVLMIWRTMSVMFGTPASKRVMTGKEALPGNGKPDIRRSLQGNRAS